MKTVGAFEAKTHFSKLLKDVINGETITISKHGTPVAIIMPIQDDKDVDVDAEINAWIAYRDQQNITLGDLSIRDLIEEGRRY